MSIPDSIELPKSETLTGIGLFVMRKSCYNLFVEFKGPPHGEESGIDIRIEGFDTPWLHATGHLVTRWFLVCQIKK